MIDLHAVALIAVIAVVTAMLRILPFLIFGGKRKTPAVVTWLGAALPSAIMGMLVVYCLKNVSIAQAPHGVPELICILLVAGLHIWKRNTLLSIIAGTLCYMALVQFVF